MGWTRTETRDPCPCGKGTVLVVMRESDNGYSGDDYYGSIDCPVCSKAHTLHERGAGTYVIRVVDGSGNVTEYEYPR